jgi:cyanophycin synthetase
MPAISDYNGHARFAAATARAMGWTFRALDGADSYAFEITAQDGRRAVIASGTANPYALNSAAAAALARDKGFAALALAAAGVAHVPGEVFFITDRHAAFRSPGREPDDARNASQSFVYPVFCKPVASSRGDGAERVADPEAFAEYCRRTAARHDAILVQPFIEAEEHRVIVLHGRALCAYRKRAPTVIGTGQDTLADLVAAARAAGPATTAAPAPVAQVVGVTEQGVRVGALDVPEVGAPVRLLGAANRALGGDADPIETPGDAGRALVAEAAARALGLTFAGVDLFQTEGGPIVIEANAAPALHTLEAQGRHDLIHAIWRANLEAAAR